MLRRTLIPLLLLTGCGHAPSTLSTMASGPVTTRVETSSGIMAFTSIPDQETRKFAIAASAEEVWQMLPAAFTALELSAGVVSESERVYGNPLLRARGKLAGERATTWLDCGKNPIGAPIANSAMLEISVMAAPQTVDQGVTSLQIQVGGIATNASGGSKTPCTSTGRLERKILEQIDLQTARRAG